MTHGPREAGRISDLNLGDLLVRDDIGTVEVTRLEKQADGLITVHYKLNGSPGELRDRWPSTHARFHRALRSANISTDNESRHAPSAAPPQRMADRAVNQYQRAFHAWPILTATAAARDTIPYGDLARRMGLHHRTVGYFLGPIQEYCLEEKLPPLTILVVGKYDRRPGAGFRAWDVANPEDGLKLVWGYAWQNRFNPFAFAADGSTPEDLSERLIAQPDEAENIYARVRDRGYAQVVFRLALLRAYNSRCAFCGLSLNVALQAAHIVPWRVATPAQRMDPSNGLLLCSTHHSLFDAGILSVGLDRKVRCHPPTQGSVRAWNSTDHQIASALHQCTIQEPKEMRLRPSDEALMYRQRTAPASE